MKKQIVRFVPFLVFGIICAVRAFFPANAFDAILAVLLIGSFLFAMGRTYLQGMRK